MAQQTAAQQYDEATRKDLETLKKSFEGGIELPGSLGELANSHARHVNLLHQVIEHLEGRIATLESRLRN